MKLFVDFQQFPLVDMRIDLGRTDIRMPQHLLDHTQVRSVRKQMTRKRMAQRMRMNVFPDPRLKRRLLHHLPDPFPVKTAATV